MFSALLLGDISYIKYIQYCSYVVMIMKISIQSNCYKIMMIIIMKDLLC